MKTEDSKKMLLSTSSSSTFAQNSVKSLDARTEQRQLCNKNSSSISAKDTTISENSKTTSSYSYLKDNADIVQPCKM
jgi:hypothetical protein